MPPSLTILLVLLAAILGLGGGALVARHRRRPALPTGAPAPDALVAERAALASERAALAQTLAQEREALARSREEERASAATAARTAAEQIERVRAALEASAAQERAALAQARRELAQEREQLEKAQAQLEAREAKGVARDQALRAREDALDRRCDSLDARDARLRERDQEMAGKLASAEAAHAQAQALVAEAQARLTTVAGLTREEARAQLLASLEQELEREQASRIARMERDLQARAKELGVEIVSRAIQRYAAEHTAESTGAKVMLADEELKGRIIGKEGRNIKSFEQATGVDIIIEEGQPAITVSCFDPVRREIARRTLVALLEDGRIHPARIEEVLARVQQDLDRELTRLGEDAAFAVEVSGLHPQLIKLLGKLHFRTSYGQNVLKHTQEVAFLCGAMAADLGLDPRLGRRCGLLHDIGKAIDHEQEGSHPQLGYEALKRYGESEIVANAALAHHEGQQPISAYTVLAAAADAISAARPGARSESSERYLKRLQQLEEIACAVPGVQKAYAIQAGRELRVIVNGHTLADQVLPKVAYDIARRIEQEVQFPGEIKVTLIRETRQIAVAR